MCIVVHSIGLKQEFGQSVCLMCTKYMHVIVPSLMLNVVYNSCTQSYSSSRKNDQISNRNLRGTLTITNLSYTVSNNDSRIVIVQMI